MLAEAKEVFLKEEWLQQTPTGQGPVLDSSLRNRLGIDSNDVCVGANFRLQQELSETFRARLGGESSVSCYGEAFRNGQKCLDRIHTCGKQLWSRAAPLLLLQTLGLALSFYNV